jgi:alkanesulfonate monooxygenase SsuD/methylene tetrahydromethanopterin reductase-like flavin-dependent oxidoreductase (luciferase family)
MAGRARNLTLGSMVVVLPWHAPMRVAEQISMLDQLSGGRMIPGLGRGVGKVEFDGFRLDMGDSRELFVEYGEALLTGLESGVMEYAGKHYRQPPTASRPSPFKSFRGRTYAAAVSPECARIMAKLGVGLLIIPQKPWPEVEKELREYNTLYREINGTPAPQPISAGWVFVDESAERAHEMAMRYIGGYYTHRARPLPVRRRPHEEPARLRVLRQDERETRRLRRPEGDRVLRRPAGLRHARAGARQDHGDPPADQ